MLATTTSGQDWPNRKIPLFHVFDDLNELSESKILDLDIRNKIFGESEKSPSYLLRISDQRKSSQART